MPVIAAGGVATLDDVKALYPLSVSANLEGAISGPGYLRRHAGSARGHGLDRRAGAVVLTWGKGRASHGSPSLAPRPQHSLSQDFWRYRILVRKGAESESVGVPFQFLGRGAVWEGKTFRKNGGEEGVAFKDGFGDCFWRGHEKNG